MQKETMIIPDKLKQGDEIRVVAPARSLSLLSDETVDFAVKKLESLGFKVTFPIGGSAKLSVGSNVVLKIIKH